MHSSSNKNNNPVGFLANKSKHNVLSMNSMFFHCIPSRTYSSYKTVNNTEVFNITIQKCSTSSISYRVCLFFSAIYHPSTKLREGNVFSRVCPSFCSQGGPNVTITHDPLHLTVPAHSLPLPPDMSPPPPALAASRCGSARPLLVTPGGHN